MEEIFGKTFGNFFYGRKKMGIKKAPQKLERLFLASNRDNNRSIKRGCFHW